MNSRMGSRTLLSMCRQTYLPMFSLVNIRKYFSGQIKKKMLRSFDAIALKAETALVQKGVFVSLHPCLGFRRDGIRLGKESVR